MTRSRRPRSRSTHREDPGLDALVAEAFGADALNTGAPTEIVSAPKPSEKIQIGPVGGSYRADQEAWVKSTGRWGR